MKAGIKEETASAFLLSLFGSFRRMNIDSHTRVETLKEPISVSVAGLHQGLFEVELQLLGEAAERSEQLAQSALFTDHLMITVGSKKVFQLAVHYRSPFSGC
jgi:hypothetical protein